MLGRLVHFLSSFKSVVSAPKPEIHSFQQPLGSQFSRDQYCEDADPITCVDLPRFVIPHLMEFRPFVPKGMGSGVDVQAPILLKNILDRVAFILRRPRTEKGFIQIGQSVLALNAFHDQAHHGIGGEFIGVNEAFKSLSKILDVPWEQRSESCLYEIHTLVDPLIPCQAMGVARLLIKNYFTASVEYQNDNGQLIGYILERLNQHL